MAVQPQKPNRPEDPAGQLHDAASALSDALQDVAHTVTDAVRDSAAESVQRFGESLRGNLSGAQQTQRTYRTQTTYTVRTGTESKQPFSQRPTYSGTQQPFSQRSFSQQPQAGGRSVYTMPVGQPYHTMIANSIWARGALGLARSAKRILAWVMGFAGACWAGGFAVLGALDALMGLFGASGFDGGVLLTAIVMAAAGGVVSYLGFNSAKRMRRFTAYLGVLGSRDWCSVAELSQAVQRNESFVVRDLRKMIRMGYFRAAFLAPDGKMLFESGESYRTYIEGQPKAQTQAQTQTTTRQQAQSECDAFLTQLRAEKARIDEPAVIEQIDAIEAHTQRIFTWVKTHPNTSGSVRRFNDYYLPTTLKLLRTYNEVDPQAANDSANVAGQIQHDIVGILHTINTAFASLEDGLLKDTAMDVAAEISAMETVMAQEGLTKGAFDDF